MDYSRRSVCRDIDLVLLIRSMHGSGAWDHRNYGWDDVGASTASSDARKPEFGLVPDGS